MPIWLALLLATLLLPIPGRAETQLCGLSHLPPAPCHTLNSCRPTFSSSSPAGGPRFEISLDAWKSDFYRHIRKAVFVPPDEDPLVLAWPSAFLYTALSPLPSGCAAYITIVFTGEQIDVRPVTIRYGQALHRTLDVSDFIPKVGVQLQHAPSNRTPATPDNAPAPQEVPFIETIILAELPTSASVVSLRCRFRSMIAAGTLRLLIGCDGDPVDVLTADSRLAGKWRITEGTAVAGSSLYSTKTAARLYETSAITKLSEVGLITGVPAAGAAPAVLPRPYVPPSSVYMLRPDLLTTQWEEEDTDSLFTEIDLQPFRLPSQLDNSSGWIINLLSSVEPVPLWQPYVAITGPHLLLKPGAVTRIELFRTLPPGEVAVTAAPVLFISDNGYRPWLLANVPIFVPNAGH